MHRNRNVEFEIILRTYQMHTLYKVKKRPGAPRSKQKTENEATQRWKQGNTQEINQNRGPASRIGMAIKIKSRKSGTNSGFERHFY